MQRPHEPGSETTLHERDFATWLAAQASAIRDGRWTDIDVEHLVEEIDDLGRSQRRELASRISVLLTHLLKIECQFERDDSRSWWSTILAQGGEIQRLLAASPSLRREVSRGIELEYARARKIASIDTGIALRDVPQTISPRVERNVFAAIDDEDFEFNRTRASGGTER